MNTNELLKQRDALLDILHEWAAWHYQKFGDTNVGGPLHETAGALNDIEAFTKTRANAKDAT